MKYTNHKLNADSDCIIEAISNINGFRAYRNREILKKRYIDGYTFEEIAEMFDMSERHIKKIVYDLEPTIIEYLRVGE